MTTAEAVPNFALPPVPADAGYTDAGYTVIYARRAAAAPVGWYGRLMAAAITGGCLAVLLVAVHLSPNPNGCGTHEGLGLAPCGFLAKFGVPCPACGMTTSFAWFVRGDLLASAYVQPMGTMLALICCGAVWAGGYIAVTGRPVHRLFAAVPDRWYLVPLMVLGVGAWAWKIGIHLRGADGWR